MSPRLAPSNSRRGPAGARARCDARVEIEAESWEDERGDGGLLRCTLRVNGLPMHLEAVAVRKIGSAGIVAAVQEDEERLAALDGMYAARWATLPIVPPGRRRARPFVLNAVPFGD
ncbi:MAG: hypothetical protein IPN83_16485 [Holophagales bacterium]|nr:hypothetical protein [Holophagales bacterium]